MSTTERDANTADGEPTTENSSRADARSGPALPYSAVVPRRALIFFAAAIVVSLAAVAVSVGIEAKRNASWKEQTAKVVNYDTTRVDDQHERLDTVESRADDIESKLDDLDTASLNDKATVEQLKTDLATLRDCARAIARNDAGGYIRYC